MVGLGPQEWATPGVVLDMGDAQWVLSDCPTDGAQVKAASVSASVPLSGTAFATYRIGME